MTARVRDMSLGRLEQFTIHPIRESEEESVSRDCSDLASASGLIFRALAQSANPRHPTEESFLLPTVPIICGMLFIPAKSYRSERPAIPDWRYAVRNVEAFRGSTSAVASPIGSNPTGGYASSFVITSTRNTRRVGRTGNFELAFHFDC